MAKQIVEDGISNARSHGIDLHHGVENLAMGDCVFECLIDGISTQDSFVEVYNGDPAYWRRKWLTEAQDIAYAFSNAGMEKETWMKEWNLLKEPRQYEHCLGDLILPAIAHCTQKNILIFNTSTIAHSPIFVIEASTLDNRPANTETPVIMAYDQSHYESLVPNTEEDKQKTIELARMFVMGKYTKKIEDIPVLKKKTIKDSFSYAGVVKRSAINSDKTGPKKNKTEHLQFGSDNQDSHSKNNSLEKMTEVDFQNCSIENIFTEEKAQASSLPSENFPRNFC